MVMSFPIVKCINAIHQKPHKLLPSNNYSSSTLLRRLSWFTIFLVQFSDLESVLASLYHIKIELILPCDCRQSWPWEVGKRVKEETVKDDAENIENQSRAEKIDCLRSPSYILWGGSEWDDRCLRSTAISYENCCLASHDDMNAPRTRLLLAWWH